MYLGANDDTAVGPSCFCSERIIGWGLDIDRVAMLRHHKSEQFLSIEFILSTLPLINRLGAICRHTDDGIYLVLINLSYMYLMATVAALRCG